MNKIALIRCIAPLVVDIESDCLIKTCKAKTVAFGKTKLQASYHVVDAPGSEVSLG